ncbi:MAG TPA: hypothetical protein VKU01_27445 [Bryobacteraceae bacterium]|nr:hypothetical protein [Bryobacteraceae bacterium]
MVQEMTVTNSEAEARQRWTLTQGAFDRFLTRLNPDRERAGKDYENLRNSLIRFFQPHAPLDADRWADTVLDRVARKNEEIDIANLGAFVWAVARVVRSEMFRSKREYVALDEQTDLQHENRTEEQLEFSQRSERIGRCVRQLPAGESDLLLRWYTCCEKASQRQKLAVSLGVSVASLRVRAHRARARLRQMVLQEGYLN